MPFVPFRNAPNMQDASRRARLAVIAACVGIFAAVLAYAISPSIRHSINHAVSRAVHRVLRIAEPKAAPALPLEVLVPPRVTLHTLRGHPAAVTFWSAACAACRARARDVELFATGAIGRGRVVGINYGDSVHSALAFIHRHHWTFTNLRDAGGRAGRQYGIKSAANLPVTYVLDSSGHIVRTVRGARSQAQLQSALAKGES
jgi:peroxiredoxin